MTRLVAVLPHRLQPEDERRSGRTSSATRRSRRASSRRSSRTALPHLFRRDVTDADGTPAWPEFKRVLIIGAGSGNDLSRALQWCPPDARIDAVEIDPVIQSHRGTAPPRPAVPGPAGDGAPQRWPQLPPPGTGRGVRPGRLRPRRFAGACTRATRTCGSRASCSRTSRSATCGACSSRRAWRRCTTSSARGGSRSGCTRCCGARSAAEPVVLTDPPRDEIKLDQFDGGMFTVFLAGSTGGHRSACEAAFARDGVVLATPRPAARSGRPAQFGAGRTAAAAGHRRGRFDPQGPVRDGLGAAPDRDGGARAGRPAAGDRRLAIPLLARRRASRA